MIHDMRWRSNLSRTHKPKELKPFLERTEMGKIKQALGSKKSKRTKKETSYERDRSLR